MNVFASWVRDATLSFLNTLRRRKSMVAGLTNNCVAMSRLRYPSLTSRAICASCGVSTSAVMACPVLPGLAPVTAPARLSRWRMRMRD